MYRSFLEYEGSKIEYFRFGSGNRLLIAIHGYRDHPSSFFPLKEVLEKQYTTYAIGLPFHGQTHWPRKFFTNEDCFRIIEQVLELEQTNEADLMGFSFGGRLILSILPGISCRVGRIYLLAPEGLQDRNTWIVLKTPYWLRIWLQKQRRSSFWLLKVASLLRRLKLLSPGSLLFLRKNLSSREQLFFYWISFNNFQIKKRLVRKKIERDAIGTFVFWGIRDAILPSASEEKITATLPGAKVFFLNSGHKLFTRELSELLQPIIDD